jgi:hypothetical protein
MENIKHEEISQSVEQPQNVENKKFDLKETVTNDCTKFSFIALALTAFVLLISLLTTFIATPTFLNRIESTIILWNLPLIIVALLVFAAVTEKQNKRACSFRRLAIVGLIISFFCTNVSKNAVQDVASNISNYVDVATATMEKEYDNVREYAGEFKGTVDKLEHKNKRMRDYDDYDDYDDYNEYDW